MIEGMSCFDETLKLKIQMNVDMIQQDIHQWQTQLQKHILQIQDNNKHSTEKPTMEDFIPTYMKKSDKTLKDMIE